MITFDNVSLQDGTYLTRYVKHDVMPNRSLATLKIGRRDGVMIIGDTFDQKVIEVAGHIRADSQAELEQKIDQFRELLSRRQRALDIDFAGGTRRYIATAINPNDVVDRDHYHNTFAPFKIHFLVPAGTGKNVNRSHTAYTGITAWNYANSITITGGYPPEPVITISMSESGTCALLVFMNLTTNKTISVSPNGATFADGDTITIDCEARSVKLNGIDHSFAGVFPEFQLGVNNFVVDFYGSTVGIEQSQIVADSDGQINADTDFAAQGFQLSGTNTCSQIDLLLKKESI